MGVEGQGIRAGIIDWNAQELRTFRSGVVGTTVVSQQLTVTMYRYEAGSSWEEHGHPEDQVTVVVSGGPITFECDGEEVVVSAGETAFIPGGVRHSARLGENGAVTINIFPPREYRP